MPNKKKLSTFSELFFHLSYLSKADEIKEQFQFVLLHSNVNSTFFLLANLWQSQIGVLKSQKCAKQFCILYNT